MAYTNIDDPSAYFTTTLWTGSGSSPRAITNDANSGNFQPDFVWTKGRNEAYEHQLYDSSRGTGESKGLTANDNSSEGYVGRFGYLSSFDSNGFTGTAGSASSIAYFNANAKTYVAWQWKVNGGTTTSKSSGTVAGNVTTPCVQQVNTDAGISIITYTASTSYAGTETHLEHGLGVGPKVLIVKRRDAFANWAVYHAENGASPNAGYGYLLLNSTAATAQSSPTNKYWLNTPAESNATLLAFGSGDDTGADGGEYVCYAFAEKQGYSKFGSYTGNGESLNGPFVYTGFKPAFVMIKNTETGGRNWYIYDNKRKTFNANGTVIRADFYGGEITDQAIDMLSNGFKVRPGALGSFGTSVTNHSGQKMIYMAFAENPFTTSTGVPTTAR
jgi:hypothetical protein